jgi:hypothetical protein
LKFIYSIIIFVFFFIFTSCSTILEEMQRITSPDGKVDVVLMRENSGATTSFVYLVYLVDKDEKVTKRNKGYEFVADKAHGMYIEWNDNLSLTIFYPQKARINGYRNYYYHYNNDGSFYTISIRIKEIKNVIE